MHFNSQVTPREATWSRKHKVSLAILACLTAAGLIAASAPAKPSTTTGTRASELQKDVDALVAAGAPGAILLAREGNRTVRLAGGLADVARKRAMRTGDHYKIASLTKTYTATVVLQLVAERKLRLSDSVERWLPDLLPNGRQITIRMLLNHSSGLPEYEADPRFLKPYLSGDFAYYWAPRELVKIALSHKPFFAPGRRFSAYSNTNYVIAGLIVEAVTGRSIGAELKRRIFRPVSVTASASRATGPPAASPGVTTAPSPATTPTRSRARGASARRC